MRSPGSRALLALAVLAACVAPPAAAQALDCTRFEELIDLPWEEADAKLGAYPSTHNVACIGQLYNDPDWPKHIHMHSTDHIYALECLHGRSPTFRELHDSMLRQGSKNITAHALKGLVDVRRGSKRRGGLKIDEIRILIVEV